MKKIEDLIKGLKHCLTADCNKDCPYYDDDYCSNAVLQDAIDILEHVKPMTLDPDDPANDCNTTYGWSQNGDRDIYIDFDIKEAPRNENQAT